MVREMQTSFWNSSSKKRSAMAPDMSLRLPHQFSATGWLAAAPPARGTASAAAAAAAAYSAMGGLLFSARSEGRAGSTRQDPSPSPPHSAGMSTKYQRAAEGNKLRAARPRPAPPWSADSRPRGTAQQQVPFHTLFMAPG